MNLESWTQWFASFERVSIPAPSMFVDTTDGDAPASRDRRVRQPAGLQRLNQRAFRLALNRCLSATSSGDGSWKVPVGFGPASDVDPAGGAPRGARHGLNILQRSGTNSARLLHRQPEGRSFGRRYPHLDEGRNR